MPDIFVSKDRLEKETKKKVKRIKKLLDEQKPKPVAKQKEPIKKIAPTSKEAIKKEASEALSRDSREHVLVKIQQEIQDILKDKPNRGFWPSFLARPRKVRFETQDKDEKVLALLRQHWIVNLPWSVLVFALLLIVPFLKYFPIFQFLPAQYLTIITLSYLLFIYYFITEKLLKWFYNVYIITDERIIDVDFLSLLYKRVSGTKITKIQDVTYDMSGFGEAFLNYGTVLIQTAGKVLTFEFENVPKPQQVVSLLNQLLLEEELEAIEGRVR